MTIDRMTLKALIEKGSDDDLLREMMVYVANRMMDLEVESLTGAAHGERSPDATQPSQRLSRAGLGDARRHGRPGDPQAQEGQLLPGLPGAAAGQREGAHGGDPGSLRARRLDALGRRSRQGDGHDRHLQEPGVAAVRRDRRARAGLPQPADRGLVAVPVDRRHLREGAPGREDRLRCRDNRCRRQHRRPARGAGPGGRAVRGGAVLDRLPALADAAGAARRQARHLR